MSEQFERYNGDRLIEWLNVNRKTSFRFECRADVAPDLVYICSGDRLLVEVTAAYYDLGHAKFLWDGTKKSDHQPQGWTGKNPDANLAKEILERIQEKSTKDYGRGCLLLVVVPPGVTSYMDLRHLLSQLEIGMTRFNGIYVAGTFPHIDVDSATGGYQVIPIHEWDGTYTKSGS